MIDSCIKNFLNKRLTVKPVTLTAEKGKVLLDLRTHLKIVSVKTFPFVKLKLFLSHQHVFPMFSSFEKKCLIACTLTSFTSFCVVDAMLPITEKYAGI